jgi:hypothetical protein
MPSTTPIQSQAKPWTTKTVLNTTRVPDTVSPQGQLTKPGNSIMRQPGTFRGSTTAKTILARRAFPYTTFTAAIRASVTIDPAGVNNSILYTAKLAGTTGNSITIAYTVSGNNTALAIGVVGNAITVTVATDAGGLPTTTASALITAINANVNASALVTAAASGTVTGTVAAVTATPLTGGVAEIINRFN